MSRERKDIMNCTEPATIETPKGNTQLASPESREGTIHFPLGLLGFENYKHFTLLPSAEEAPFLKLKMRDDPELAFLVISPS